MKDLDWYIGVVLFFNELVKSVKLENLFNCLNLFIKLL